MKFQYSTTVFGLLLIFTTLSCSPGDDGFISDGNSNENSTASLSGSIVVSNINSKNVVLLSPNGTWVRDLLVLDRTSTDVAYGVALSTENKLLVSVDGVDRVSRVDLTGENPNQEFILNGNLTGNLRDITQLANGDILVVETSNVERFYSDGLRAATGGWPRALQTVGSGISAFSDSGFVHCSTTTDVVRTYDNDGLQIATASSGISGTTDVVDCAAGPDGQVAAIFNGTTDTIRVYSSRALTTIVFSYSNLALLANPRVVNFRANGNLLIVDGTSNLIVELDPTGTLVGTIAAAAVNNASDLVVIP